MTPRRWLAIAMALVAALVAASVVVAVVRSPREETFAPGSPEAVVQGFLRALSKGDYETARGYLSEADRQRCTLSLLRRMNLKGRLADSRVEMEDALTSGDTASVTLRVREEGSPLGFEGGGGYTHTETYDLVRDQDQWRLSVASGASSPWRTRWQTAWPLYEC